MVCMSASVTSKISEDLSDYHDLKVKLWKYEFKEHIEDIIILYCFYSTTLILVNACARLAIYRYIIVYVNILDE